MSFERTRPAGLSWACVLAALLLCAAGLGAGAAGWPGDDASSLWLGGSDDDSAGLKDYDIDRVVEETTKAMSAAARNYYLPDGTGDAKALKRYSKDARSYLFMHSSFKRELARVCVDLAKAARDADSPAVKYLPLTKAEPARPDYEEGVSSIGVTAVSLPDGEVTADYTNTMPCINAAGQALRNSTLAQFPKVGKDAEAEAAYGRGFAQILTANRLFNHELAEVCAKLVHIARDEAERGRPKKRER